MTKLLLENSAPFQGLPEIVADEEGLFAEEGLEIEWVERDQDSQHDSEGLNPFLSHGKMLERGKADLYNACEWGNYCRVEQTGVQSRQVGRRAIVTYGAIVVGPASSVYTPQQLADVSVGVPFYFGTHYLALHLLSGFLPREMVKVCSAAGPVHLRFRALMDGSLEATTLVEPYVSLAEKLGCRVICSAFYHGTDVASDRLAPETYAAYTTAVRAAVKRINENKSAYMHHFIDYHFKRGRTEMAQLKVSDLRESRIVVTDPTPIPTEELERTANWLKSWGMLEKTKTPDLLVNKKLQEYAHVAAE